MGIAERSGLIAPQLCKMLLTTVALSMAATPMLAEAGTYISMKIEKEKGRIGDCRIDGVCTAMYCAVLYVMILSLIVGCILRPESMAIHAIY